jgi:pimeloyl-ACP methyl ester carboxylesterase
VFSTTELSNGIKIAYDFYEADAKKSKTGGPIVFIHGFFGSKRNNRSMSKYAYRARRCKEEHSPTHSSTGSSSAT